MSLKKLINKIPLDKKDHVLLGMILGFPLVIAFDFWGGMSALILVTAKEVVYDKLQNKGNPEFLDFVYSAVPIIMLMITKAI